MGMQLDAGTDMLRKGRRYLNADGDVIDDALLILDYFKLGNDVVFCVTTGRLIVIGPLTLVRGAQKYFVRAAAKTISTPHGSAVQELSAEARAALTHVENGGEVFRQGNFDVQNTGDAQFWSLQNPASAGNFADRMGIPGGADDKVDWMMGGRVIPGAPVITRPAPGIGTNVGGDMEAVVETGSVRIDWFHMPD
jgi:hypothetical protein